MNKKLIQEQRKKGYFIEAAKKIIREDGLNNITVKKIADLAGYAPGTLYNYFQDLKDLYIYCAEDFWHECRDYLIEETSREEGIKSLIITGSKAYCEYFIDNPNVFQLIFLEDLGKLPEESPEVVQELIKLINKGVEEGLIAEEKKGMIQNLIANFIHGVLLFYIKGRTNAKKKEALRLIGEEIEYILEH